MRSRSLLLLAAVLCSRIVSLAQGTTCDSAPLIQPGSFTSEGPFQGEGASQADAVNADWYALDPIEAGYISVTSCGGPRDTRVHIHTGSCNDLITLGTDDDGCPGGYPPGNSFLANVPITPGNIYFIEWDDRWSTQGFDWQLLYHTCPIIQPSFEVSDNSILVDWPVLASGATFTIEYGPQGFTPGTGTVITGVQGDTSPPVSIAELPSGTTYDLYIISDCGGGDVAPFDGPWHATTSGQLEIANEDCGGAIPISCGSVTQGNTTGSQADPVADCGTGIGAPGIWYTFTGVEGTVVLSTCADHGYDTKLNVYSGPCDQLLCVDGNDDGPGACYPGSEVVLTASAALTYNVLVEGYDNGTGPFGLAMDCPTCAPPTALTISQGDTLAYLGWNSGNATSTYSVEYGPAGFVPGSGTIVSGTVGVDGPPVLLAGLVASSNYDAYVTEDCGGGDLSLTRGPIGFTTLDVSLAANAFCASPAPIACGDSLAGNTTLGLLTGGPTCASADITSKSVWFSFLGDGSDVTLSTCGLAAFDTKISVFSGACGALVCAGGNDDGNGCAGNTSAVTVYSVPGINYLVMVHGYQDGAGAFTLVMSCDEPCFPNVPNDDCLAALTLSPQPVGFCVPLEATNACAYPSALPNPPCDPFAPIVDVWFALPTGPSADHTVTITSTTAGGMNAALYSDCEQFEYVSCFAPVDGPLALTGLSTETTYYLRIWNGGGTDAGTFTVCDEASLITAIGDVRTTELSVYPVPAKDELQVTGLPAETRTISVLDAQGRVLLLRSTNGSRALHLDVGSLAPGCYFLKAEGTRSRVTPVVIE